MSIDLAISEWRQYRQLVSDDKAANLDAWETELDAILSELGFSYADLTAHLSGSPHDWIEGEYEAFLEEPGQGESPSKRAPGPAVPSPGNHYTERA
jgi:hypothetical protein